MQAPGMFCFLNEVHELTPGNWDSPELGRLWRYNLHYFDDLNAENGSERVSWQQELLLQWIRENPPASGTGWEPYPTSLRIVNWIKWVLAGNTLPGDCAASLALQSRWLIRRLEYHILGNHLFANAKALVFAGIFFEGAEADRWLARGMAILERELPRQILPDGGHFERSPMYHAIILEDLLDLINLSRSYPRPFGRWKQVADGWEESAIRMAIWLRTMLHPDGEISFFNDAAIGITPFPAAINDYGRRLGLSFAELNAGRLSILPDSGYMRVVQDSDVFIVDVAKVGPDYLPGHAHADTLCFEGSLFGRRVFVNSGTSCYGDSCERIRQRGTAAHNTVVVENENSSEVWGSFRVARRAYPKVLEVNDGGESLTIKASHDGYRRLAGKNIHRREWTFAVGSLTVRDEIQGGFDSAEARFHLHPDVKAEAQSPETCQIELLLATGQRAGVSVAGGTIHIEPSTWHPEFGVSQPNLCLVVRFLQPEVFTSISWPHET